MEEVPVELELISNNFKKDCPCGIKRKEKHNRIKKGKLHLKPYSLGVLTN